MLCQLPAQLAWLPPCRSHLCISAGCLGLAFFNATAGSRAVLRHMLHHAQSNMHVMFDDQQALNHQLVMVRRLECCCMDGASM